MPWSHSFDMSDIRSSHNTIDGAQSISQQHQVSWPFQRMHRCVLVLSGRYTGSLRGIVVLRTPFPELLEATWTNYRTLLIERLI